MNRYEVVLTCFMGVIMAGVGTVIVAGFEIARLLVERANDVGHALR